MMMTVMNGQNRLVAGKQTLQAANGTPETDKSYPTRRRNASEVGSNRLC
jgi:hypothetical protein